VVDPYARADFFLAFGTEGEVKVEEGFITFLSLPLDLQVKVGQLKGAFGKLNTQHLHIRPFADVPLPMVNLLGGDDGIEDAGVSVSRLIPAPAGIFLEGTAQLLRGTSDNLFQAHNRNDVEPLFHLRGYGDISEAINLEVGGSWTRANNLEGPGYHTRLTNVDATFRWKPLQQALYKGLLARFEWYLSERETPAGRVRADGFYLFGEWRLGRRWFAGARWDASDHADDAALRDRSGSLVLTFWPSEFSRFRLQGSMDAPGWKDDPTWAVMLAGEFVVGAHGAHKF
jgi:hypothetical protein